MAIILGLWSVILEPGKTYTQETTRGGIQITNVSFGAEVTGSARTVVTMKYPDFVDPESDDEDSESEGDDELKPEIEMPEMITKETVIAILKPDVTEQVSINISLVEEVEIVEFSISGPNAVHLVGHYVRQEDMDEDPYSDSEYGSDDESIDSDMEGMSGMLGEDSDEEEGDDEERFEEVKEVKKVAAANPKKRAAEEVAAAAVADDADVSMSSTLSKNQKKKAAKKLKTEDGTAAPAPVAAAVVEKKESKIEAPAKKAAGPVSQTLAGGLVITDSKVGEGIAAKSGKKVGMRYIGKLANGKVFDSNTKGAPLVFTLGRGEVIKGWDLGVAGMKVGGERKLVIPAALA